MRKILVYFLLSILSHATLAQDYMDVDLERRMREMFRPDNLGNVLTPFDIDGVLAAHPDESPTGGFSSGGGGNAVVCLSDDGGVSEIDLLDYFEGIRKDDSQKKRVVLKGDTLEEKIKSAFRTMERGYPHLAKKLRNRALWLANNIEYFLLPAKDGKLTPIYDMDLPFGPNENRQGQKCQIIRFAVQLKKHIEGQKKFFFVKELFEHPKTTLITKAGIILHEVIYEEAIKNGAQNSDFVRWFTYLISSLKFDQMTDREIAALEHAPGGDFLSGFGIENRAPRRNGNSDYDTFRARDNVFVLDIYDIGVGPKKSSCYETGLCQLLTGEYLGKKANSSALFPKFSIMMKSGSIRYHAPGNQKTKEITKVRGEIWSGYATEVASTNDGTCHPDGGCIGDLVGVETTHENSITSYTGVIVGLFKEGDLAVKLIDGRFEYAGENINPYLLNPRDKDIVLYAARADVTIVE